MDERIFGLVFNFLHFNFPHIHSIIPTPKQAETTIILIFI